jgi:hypothetical protein
VSETRHLLPHSDLYTVRLQRRYPDLTLSRAKVAKNVIDVQNARTAHSTDPTARTLAANQTHSSETALRGGPKGVARGI